jgi:hypothetical protein
VANLASSLRQVAMISAKPRSASIASRTKGLPALALSACSRGQDESAPVQAQRIDLAAGYALPDVPPEQPKDAIWRSEGPDRVSFGSEGQPALLTFECSGAGREDARIVITRRVLAPEGAKALFAIEGFGISRYPLDVVRPGNPGEWRGSVEALDPSASAIGAGGKATLPGGGTLRLPYSGLTGELLRRCRGGRPPRKAEPVAVESGPAEEPEGQ